MWKYYTGLAYDIVHLIFEYVESSISLTSLTVLTKFNQLLLALIKLRLDLHFKDLAYRFKISRTTASSPGDVVLADRGFLIKETLAILQAKVIVPAFTKSKSQLRPLEIEETRNIAHVRIHVERIIGIKSDSFKSKKSKILTSKNINDFLEHAADDKYLFMKVALIIGISGACRKQELRNIKPSDIQDTGKNLIINIRDSKTKRQRSFVVSEYFYPN
ncbi:hypothetical protein NQ315_008949 [Exocentrus adspersus]|uniref:DDE Tnp4 domain-containing protein n=1 Tax=Exocentrus adspersus TaxID=1586481 RepID=A0AAV8V8T8_9CUCU|nr:hypothetical protein NQ315_008949 [Exocentrus adspersus]